MLVTVLKYTPSTRLGKMKEKNVLVLVCVDPCDKFAVVGFGQRIEAIVEPVEPSTDFF